MEKRVGTIEQTLKEIQEHMVTSKDETTEKFELLTDKLNDVLDVVTKLQGTIIFVLASGSLVGAVILTILTAVIGL